MISQGSGVVSFNISLSMEDWPMLGTFVLLHLKRGMRMLTRNAALELGQGYQDFCGRLAYTSGSYVEVCCD